MSDIRFTILGITFIFVGFIVLGVFGSQFVGTAIQAEEFENCFEYFEDKPPIPVDCVQGIQEKYLFFGLVIGLITGGIISLIKGVKGKWDQDVKPEDMLGPSDSNTHGFEKKD